MRACAGVFSLALVLFAGCSRSQAASQQAPPPPPLEYLGSWGTAGPAAGQFLDPVSIALDTVGNVYVVNWDDRLLNKFDSNGHPLLSFAAVSGRPGQIAVDTGDAIYVVDSQERLVRIFRPDGKLLRWFRGGPGRHFRHPVGVAVDGDGYIYVSDSLADRIEKLDARGRLRRTWGRKGSGPGDFDEPAGVAVSPDYFVYVNDSGNHRIEKFSDDGSYLTEWQVEEAGAPGQNCISGLAASSQYIFAVDCSGEKILVWTPEGKPKLAFALADRMQNGAGNGTAIPGGVALATNQELLVLDRTTGKVLRFRIHF